MLPPIRTITTTTIAITTTIMTTMSRLFDKGLLERELEGRAYHYTAALTRSELGSSVSRRVVDALMGSFAEPTMAYFVEALSDEDPDRLDTLAELIRERRKKTDDEDA